MKPPRIDHIGIVVAGLEVAAFEAENLVVELLRYTDRGDGFGRAVMGDAGGINHLSLAVPDLDAALAALRAQGVEPMPGFPRRGAHGRIAFLPRDATTGLRFEDRKSV